MLNDSTDFDPRHYLFRCLVSEHFSSILRCSWGTPGPAIVVNCCDTHSKHKVCDWGAVVWFKYSQFLDLKPLAGMQQDTFERRVCVQVKLRLEDSVSINIRTSPAPLRPFRALKVTTTSSSSSSVFSRWPRTCAWPSAVRMLPPLYSRRLPT